MFPEEVDPGTAILVSAFVALLVGLASIRQQRRIAARRAALQLILERQIHDHSWERTCRRARTILKERKRWEPLIPLSDAPPESIEASALQDDLAAVQVFLDHHELVAIAIRKRIVDKALYAMWARTVYVDHWNTAEAFVGKWRTATGRLKAIREFEAQADDWRERGFLARLRWRLMPARRSTSRGRS